MNDDKLNAIMEVFEKLSHVEQVELFLQIKEGLLKQRSVRIQTHSKNADYEKENIDALYVGNDMINGIPSPKAGN